MKNRTSLMLMEQLVMLLVFALAAALCLGVFAEADQISRETARRDQAALIAQNAAEILKASCGDAERTAGILEGNMPGNYRLEISKTDSGSRLLGKAEIRIYQGKELLFMLETGWQEGES